MDAGRGGHVEVSRTASSNVATASAVSSSVKNCSATAGAMVKQSTPWRARATIDGTSAMLASSTLVALPVAVSSSCMASTSPDASRPAAASRRRYGAMYVAQAAAATMAWPGSYTDRKSTRLNSSHM